MLPALRSLLAWLNRLFRPPRTPWSRFGGLMRLPEREEVDVPLSSAWVVRTLKDCA